MNDDVVEYIKSCIDLKPEYSDLYSKISKIVTEGLPSTIEVSHYLKEGNSFRKSIVESVNAAHGVYMTSISERLYRVIYLEKSYSTRTYSWEYHFVDKYIYLKEGGEIAVYTDINLK